jgi:hypothetical protein
MCELGFAVTHHGVRQTTDDSMARAHCMLGNRRETRTRISTTYCPSTSIVDAQTVLSVTLCVNWLSCYN